MGWPHRIQYPFHSFVNGRFPLCSPQIEHMQGQQLRLLPVYDFGSDARTLRAL